MVVEIVWVKIQLMFPVLNVVQVCNMNVTGTMCTLCVLIITYIHIICIVHDDSWKSSTIAVFHHSYSLYGFKLHGITPYLGSILMMNLDFMAFGRQCKFHVPLPP